LDFGELRLSHKLQKGVESAGYKVLFPIQERAIRPLLMGKNVIGQAQTGSGKTVAFGLPLLERIDEARHSIQALVLAPTRELAQQTAVELTRLARYTGVRVLAVFGGQSINVQLDELDRGVHVVVGTPGRIIDHLRRRSMDLRDARFVVIDEADRMLDMGFLDDVNFILERTPTDKQLALFSATMPNEIVRLTERYMPESEKILIDSEEPSVESLDQYYTMVSREEKLQTLLGILGEEGIATAIVFCRTKYGARRLARDLDKRYLNAVALHGDLSQAQRDHSMNLFRSGRADVLVATDVASRGLDIANIDCVVNYDVPDEPLVYFHRVGRTARAGKAGRSYTLVSPEEFSDFARILELTKVKIKGMKPEDEMYNVAAPSGGGPSRHRQPRRWKSRGYSRTPSHGTKRRRQRPRSR
jgi:ATP-dependent RNA helicase DeaD